MRKLRLRSQATCLMSQEQKGGGWIQTQAVWPQNWDLIAKVKFSGLLWMLPEEWFSLFMGFQFSPSFTDTTNICHVQNLLYYGFTYVVTWHPHWVVTISFITPTRKWRSEKLLSTLFSRSVVSNSLWPHGPQHVRPPCPSSTPEFTQTHVHGVGDAIQPSHPLSSPSPSASIFRRIRVFSNESALHIRWPKDWSFSFSSSPSNEHPGLISLRMDWLDLLAVQETLKSLLQHHGSKASILQLSFFFIQFFPAQETSHTVRISPQPDGLWTGNFCPTHNGLNSWL